MLRPGQGLVLVTIALLCVGVVMVNSTGLRIASGESLELRSILLSRPALVAALAMLAVILGSSIPIRRLERARRSKVFVSLLVGALILLLLAVHIPGIGREVNGAKRWIAIGPVGFQPSEFAKWMMPVLLAWYATQRADVLHKYGRGFLPPILLITVVCALIATEDLGTAVLIGAVSMVVLIAAGTRLTHALTLLPGAVAGFVAAVLLSPYRIERLRTFFDPFGDPQGAGYHMVQSMAAVSGGGLAGRGLGNSIQKFGYLPEDTTDFIFAIICEETGVVGAALVVSLYITLCLCGLSIIRQTASSFTRLLAIGIVFTIGGQTLINLAVVTGLGPTKGIALPLISWGGTGWVLTAFSLGLLSALDRTPTPEQVVSTAQGIPVES